MSTAFPILTTLGIVLACGSFLITSLADREQKLRYLLNFAGMRSASYYLGLLAADLIIYTVPQVLMAIMVFVL